MHKPFVEGRAKLLFLCHRIPYPPNKGDKIRSFHLLHHLSQEFNVYLATFVDDPADWPYQADVEKFCVDSIFCGLRPGAAKVKSLVGLLSGQPLSLPYYANREMAAWVDNCTQAQEVDHVVVYSSAMAQYVLNEVSDFQRKVIDFVDVDSDKWFQYAEQKSWPMSWLLKRESRALLDYEVALAKAFDAGLFVSSAEADLFRDMSPATAHKIGFYNNGVNVDYFDAQKMYENPYPDDCVPVVFTGAMDYWPNVDAVKWFATEVLPLLREREPTASFYIVGGNPSRDVQRLVDLDGVFVTGRVEDIRPYIRHAAVIVAPMRLARGVQNKVLEAMALAKSVVVSGKGLEGIDARHGHEVLVADDPEEYVNGILSVLEGDYPELGNQALRHVRQHFDWDNNLPEVALLLTAEGSDNQPALSPVD